ncbi:43895_t:CDS:2, partial [Gigaspora margarita]
HAFTEKLYNLQVESQSGFKGLIKYLDAIRQQNKHNRKPTAYKSFLHLTCNRSENNTREEAIQIYGIFMYYIALCGNGTKKNYHYALSVAKFLEEYNKHSDALKLYELLNSKDKVTEIKNKLANKNNLRLK